jgi:1-acylglycerone phosphate reductase
MSSPKRWAIITGVSEGGLGDALTTELLSNNINVVATSLDLGLLRYLPDNERLQKVELDVTCPNSTSAAVERVTNITNGKLDFLINNAGYGYMMPLLDAPLSQVKKNYEVNVFGLLATTQAFFPLLKAGRGMVVNQSSIAGLQAGSQPFIGVYSSTKAAVNALSNVMRIEFEPFGVKVCRSELLHLSEKH